MNGTTLPELLKHFYIISVPGIKLGWGVGSKKKQQLLCSESILGTGYCNPKEVCPWFPCVIDPIVCRRNI